MPGIKEVNESSQEFFVMSYDHAAITADSTTKLWKVPRALRVDRVSYINPTGLAEDTTNVFNIKLLKGASTVVANWSTDSDLLVADASIPADTFFNLTLTSTDADKVFAKDDVMSFFADEGGDSTLPAGRIVIEGRFIE